MAQQAQNQNGMPGMLIQQGTPADAAGIAAVVAEAFGEFFERLGVAPHAMGKLLTAMVVPQRFMVARDQNNAIVGVAGWGDAQGYSIVVDQKVLRRSLGFMRGSIIGRFLQAEIQRPHAFMPGQAQVDWVAVAKTHRGRGIAGRLLGQLLAQTDYSLYTLEVVEGNERVIPLYERLGFAQTGRLREKAARLKGFHYRHVMACRPAQAKEKSSAALHK